MADFEIDNLTVGLLTLLTILLFYLRFFGPSPLVHPLLLSRQSDVSPVRQPGETGTYRAFATSHGAPLQVRPAGQLKTIADVVNVPPPNAIPGKPVPVPTQRYILDAPLTNGALREITRLLPLGLRALFPAQQGTATSPRSVLALLPPQASLPLLLLSLTSRPSSPLVVLRRRDQLATALKNTAHPTPGLLVIHESAFPEAVEQDLAALRAIGAGVVIVSDPERKQAAVAKKAEAAGVPVKWWEDIWDAGEKAPAGETEPVEYSDVHSYFYTDAGVVTASHMNMTAGIAGILSMFPADKRLTGRDVVGSTIRLDTPFGMALALAAVWSGSGFRLIAPPQVSWDDYCDPVGELDALEESEQPLPTVLFMDPAYHIALVARLHAAFLSNPLGSWAARHTLNYLRAGVVSRGGWLDTLVWRSVRAAAPVAESLRAVVVVGPTSVEILGPSNAFLGLPLSRAYSSPLSAGPIFTSHFYDIQGPVPDLWAAPKSRTPGHTGPPASNVEVVLKGPLTEPADEGAPLRGKIWARGPAVLDPKGGWVELPDEASVATNGTFVVHPSEANAAKA